MGEYASYKGKEIKIGTCEDMYYLRWAQRHDVRPLPGNVNPVKDAHELRFRFPWPDETHLLPGDDGPDHDYDRAVTVPGLDTLPDDFDHYSVQFHASAGYLVSLPCPESAEGRAASGYTIHRNGFAGALRFGQLKPTEDGQTLRLIGKCGGCGAKFRYETWDMVEPVVVAIRSAVDRWRLQNDARANFYASLADTITAGYPEGRAARDRARA